MALAEAVPRVNAPDGNVHSCDISFRTVITSGIEGETGQRARAGSGDFSSRCDISFWEQVHIHRVLVSCHNSEVFR